MLLFRLTTKTYLSPQPLVYLPIDVPVHNPTHSFSYSLSDNHQDLPVNVSTVLHVHRCTCSSLYLFSLFLIFWHNLYSVLSTRLIYWGIYTHIHPKRNLPVYPHAFPWSNKKYLPVSTTCVPAHICTCS